MLDILRNYKEARVSKQTTLDKMKRLMIVAPWTTDELDRLLLPRLKTRAQPGDGPSAVNLSTASQRSRTFIESKRGTDDSESTSMTLRPERISSRIARTTELQRPKDWDITFHVRQFRVCKVSQAMTLSQELSAYVQQVMVCTMTSIVLVLRVY